MSASQSRKPKGQPTGGQFAAKSNPESDTELDSGPIKAISPDAAVEPSRQGLTREVQIGSEGRTES